MAIGLPGLAGSAALSFLPALFSKLFGSDPQAVLRKTIGRLTAPEAQSKELEKFYQQIIGSPAFTGAQGTIAAGANVAGGNLARELGARGIGTTGTGAVLSSLIPSIVGGQQSQLRTSAFQSAQQMQQDRLKAIIDSFMQTQGPSQSQQLFAGGLGALGPLLLAYLTQQKPPTGGGRPISQ